MDHTDSLACNMETRATMYLMLQSIFGTQPSEAQLEALRGSELSCAFDAASSDKEYCTAKEAFLSYLDVLSFDDSVVEDYTRAFIGPASLAAPPWESVYVNQENLLMVESTIEVRKAYLDQGYAPKLFPHVADDHIALELDFLKRLAANAAECLREGDPSEASTYISAMRSFLQAHLLRWIDPYTQALENSAGPYYAKAARLLRAYVRADARALAQTETNLT